MSNRPLRLDRDRVGVDVARLVRRDVVGEVVVQTDPAGEPVAQAHRLGEGERRPDRGDQGDQLGSALVDQRPVGEAFEQQRDQPPTPAWPRPARPGVSGRPCQAPGRRVGAVEEDEDPRHGEGPVHEDFGVGEVDELQDAVHHRVAEGDQGVDRAEHQAADGEAEEVVEAAEQCAQVQGGPSSLCRVSDRLRPEVSLRPQPGSVLRDRVCYSMRLGVVDVQRRRP